jgi:hypothetical protein
MQRPPPDDPRAEQPTRYVLVGLASLVMLAGAVALLILPPLAAVSAVRRGHPVLAGTLVAGYVLGIALVGRKLFSAPQRPRDPDRP